MTNKNVCGYIVLRKGSLINGLRTTIDGNLRAAVETVEVGHDWGYEEFNAAIGADTGSVLHVKCLTDFIPKDVRDGHGITGIDMWIDDEGRLREENVVNEFATVLTSQLIYGDCVLMTSDHEGNSSPLKNDVLANVLKVVDGLTNDERAIRAVAIVKQQDAEWVDKHGLISVSFDSVDGVENV